MAKDLSKILMELGIYDLVSTDYKLGKKVNKFRVRQSKLRQAADDVVRSARRLDQELSDDSPWSNLSIVVDEDVTPLVSIQVATLKQTSCGRAKPDPKKYDLLKNHTGLVIVAEGPNRNDVILDTKPVYIDRVTRDHIVGVVDIDIPMNYRTALLQMYSNLRKGQRKNGKAIKEKTQQEHTGTPKPTKAARKEQRSSTSSNETECISGKSKAGTKAGNGRAKSRS